MAEEVKEGDWISYPEGEGQVIVWMRTAMVSGPKAYPLELYWYLRASAYGR